MRRELTARRTEMAARRRQARRFAALPAALAVILGGAVSDATPSASATGCTERAEERVSVAAVGSRGEKKPRRKQCNHTPRECVDYMSRKMRASGWVGVELEFDGKNFNIQRVIVDSPAEEAGLEVGDVLLAIDGVPSKEIAKRMSSGRDTPKWKPGQEIKYTIEREGRGRTIEIEMGRMPAHVLARYIGQHLIEYEHVDESHEGADH